MYYILSNRYNQGMDKKHKELKRLIEKANSILILSHRGPDMDAFCSMLVLKEFLTVNYPNKEIIAKSKKMPSFNIPNMHDIKVVESIDEGNEDLIIITDAGNIELVCEPTDTIINTKKDIVVIDHHQHIYESPKVVINEQVSSATEQVFWTFMEILGNKFKLTENIAEIGQYGIIADTGRFLYETTSSDTLRLYADLRDFSPIDVEDYTYKHGKVPQGSSDVIAFLLSKLQIKGDMAYTYISREDLKDNDWEDGSIGEAINFVKNNYLRFIQGVHWGFMLKPSKKEEGVWWLSFRSTKNYQKVDKIAKALGGGGHIYASGAKLEYEKDTPVGDIIQDVLDAIDKETTLS